MKFEYTLAELSTAITALEQVYGKVSVLDPYLGTVLDPATLQPTAMKKKFAIEVDCANCAAKIETAVKELPGVTNASISFMAQKMMLEADDDKFDAVLQEAVKVAKKVEPDFEIEL